MPWVIFSFVTLIALGRFADFLLGEHGSRRVKDRLVLYYVTLAEGKWSEVFRSTTQVVKSEPCWITSTGPRLGYGARRAACARHGRDRAPRGSRATDAARSHRR